MKYGHAVKHNGVLYPAGAEVPVGIAPKAPEPVEPKPVVQEEAPKPKTPIRKKRK